jgi:hypothetical protein
MLERGLYIIHQTNTGAKNMSVHTQITAKRFKELNATADVYVMVDTKNPNYEFQIQKHKVLEIEKSGDNVTLVLQGTITGNLIKETIAKNEKFDVELVKKA